MLIGTVLDELERQNKSAALITMCIGGGMEIRDDYRARLTPVRAPFVRLRLERLSPTSLHARTRLIRYRSMSLQPARLGDLEPAVLRLPLVKSRVRDPVPPTHLRRLCPRLRLPQDPDDLLLAEPAALHLSVSFQ